MPSSQQGFQSGSDFGVVNCVNDAVCMASQFGVGLPRVASLGLTAEVVGLIFRWLFCRRSTILNMTQEVNLTEVVNMGLITK